MNAQITGLIISFVLIFFYGNSSFAQGKPSSDTTINIIHSDNRIETLVDRYNKTHEIHGYRIQIISSSKKEEAKKAKSKFASLYQNVEAHETYQQPFFIIKVGDFLTKLEAEKFHREIAEEFQGSFIVPDMVEPYKQYTSVIK